MDKNDTFSGRQEALAAAAQHTPYGEVLLAQKYELDLIHEQLAEIKAAIERLAPPRDFAEIINKVATAGSERATA